MYTFFTPVPQDPWGSRDTLCSKQMFYYVCCKHVCVFYILPSLFTFLVLVALLFQVALLTIVYKKKAGQPSCYYRHLKKRRVEKEKANRGANKQVNRRSTKQTLTTLAFARLVALLLLKTLLFIYFLKRK